MILDLDAVEVGKSGSTERSDVLTATADCRRAHEVRDNFHDFHLRRQDWNVGDIDLVDLLIRTQSHDWSLG